MKKIFLLLNFVLVLALAGQAYQTKSTPRPNFSSAAVENKAEVPGQQGVQTRTFSNYGSRRGGWRQGVKTETVKTPSAQEVKNQEKEFAPIEQLPAPVATKKDPVKKEASATSATANRGQAAASAKAEPTQASTQPATAEAVPAAMMEQLQGLQKMMSGLGGAGGNPAAGNAAGGAMPDLSSLLNAAPGAQTPQPKK